MNNEFLNKHAKRLFDKSFEKTLLDQPVINKKVKFSLRENKPKLEKKKITRTSKTNKTKTYPKTPSKIKKTSSIT